jgi:hypothetical protein
MSVIEPHDPDDQHSHVSITQEPTTATSLPPADGGLAAWRLLITAFIFEALLWGQPATISRTNSSQSNTELQKPRFPALFRRLPSALLHSPRVQRFALHRRRRNDSIRHVLPSRAHHHPVRQALRKVPLPHDLDRL